MKKELKILGTLFLMITSTFGFSQGEIHGKVFEKESNLPIIILGLSIEPSFNDGHLSHKTTAPLNASLCTFLDIIYLS